ncbi:MAG TPA: aminoacyl-tRNA hydrolase [Eubacteriales bacterium]|jgi:PTH1 family peptidyl-tRNA hydrolase|nr:aminoacyl-tRNA hydrolase [Clostridia bacterium]HRR89619.1 aminoacyl-tRNA hydrolase [Eubacteriales bacterium]HRU83769.1 aminoacyl-tRNA hydrolase [Eubacteriales bacterium]
MLIVGLGNIGGKYKNTYHNMGFMAVDELAGRLGVKFKTKECKAQTAIYYDADEKVILAKPETYMNLSGEAVYELMNRYSQTAKQLVVVYDDFDLPLGQIRIREEGGGGSHNGMKNIILNIETKNFLRLRIGLGGSGEGDPMDLVLRKIKKEDREPLEAAAAKAAEALEAYINGLSAEKLMQRYNK